MSKNEFMDAYIQAWKWIEGDGKQTGKEMREWSEQLDEDVVRRVLCSIISLMWHKQTPYIEEENEELD